MNFQRHLQRKKKTFKQRHSHFRVDQNAFKLRRLPRRREHVEACVSRYDLRWKRRGGQTTSFASSAAAKLRRLEGRHAGKINLRRLKFCCHVAPPVFVCLFVCFARARVCLRVSLLCTLAVIIVSNNLNEETGTGCVQSSNYKLISCRVAGSN